MKIHTIDRSTWSPRPVEDVWADLADARSWPTWSPMDEAGLDREGSPTADGVGAIRRFTTGRSTSVEEVVVFDAPTHLAYTLISGLPLRDYRADVTLTPERGGTTIRWQSRFGAKRPGTGWLYRRVLGIFIDRLVKALAAHGVDAPVGS